MRAASPLVERAREHGREVAVIGLAKRLEEVYVPGSAGPGPDPARLGGARGCCSGSATRPTASRSTSTASVAARR